MPDLIFAHPNLKTNLKVQTGADGIEWSYGLNTQSMPTYGGEVVQILSAYVDDITIVGTLKSYRKMEAIYKWFIEYIQTATQREQPNDPRFKESPVHMFYPHRGWHLKFKPTGLPGFRLGTDVTAPAWQVSGAVSESDPNMNKYTLKEAAKRDFDFTNIKAGVGWDEDNPFTNVAAAGSKYDVEDINSKITDWYHNLIPSYLDHDFEDLFGAGFLGSKPVTLFDDKKGKDGDEHHHGNNQGGDQTDNSNDPGQNTD